MLGTAPSLSPSCCSLDEGQTRRNPGAFAVTWIALHPGYKLTESYWWDTRLAISSAGGRPRPIPAITGVIFSARRSTDRGAGPPRLSLFKFDLVPGYDATHVERAAGLNQNVRRDRGKECGPADGVVVDVQEAIVGDTGRIHGHAKDRHLRTRHRVHRTLQGHLTAHRLQLNLRGNHRGTGRHPAADLEVITDGNAAEPGNSALELRQAVDRYSDPG